MKNNLEKSINILMKVFQSDMHINAAQVQYI